MAPAPKVGLICHWGGSGDPCLPACVQDAEWPGQPEQANGTWGVPTAGRPPGPAQLPSLPDCADAVQHRTLTLGGENVIVKV